MEKYYHKHPRKRERFRIPSEQKPRFRKNPRGLGETELRVVAVQGLARLSLGDLAIGPCGAAQG